MAPRIVLALPAPRRSACPRPPAPHTAPRSSGSTNSADDRVAVVAAAVLLLLDRRRCCARARKPCSRLRPSSVSRNRCSASARATQPDQIVLVAHRERGSDQVVPHALLAQMHLQAVGEEADQLAVERRRARLRTARRSLPGAAATRPQRQPQAILEDQPDDARARRGAARTGPWSRSGGCRRRRSRPACRACRPAPRRRSRAPSGSVVGALGRVVLADGVSHRGGLALRRGIVAAHDALQLGELADHAGDEIGLGQQRRALGRRPVGARHVAARARRSAPPAARTRCALRAELGVEHHARPAPAGGSRARPCGPGPRRTRRPTAGRAARARCRRRWPRRRRWPPCWRRGRTRRASAPSDRAQRQSISGWCAWS